METSVAINASEFNHPAQNADQVLVERRALWVKGLSRVSVRAVSGRKRVVGPGRQSILVIEFLTQVSLAILNGLVNIF
jgi:hypothetical protein